MTTTPLMEEATGDGSAPIDIAVANPDQDLLDQLLETGQSYNQQDSTDEVVARKRKLLEVVFDACISRPITESPDSPPTQVELERAQLTLDILKRQIASLPEVLLSAAATESEDGSRPVYAWLITRIIAAATHYEQYSEARGLVNALCDAGVHILGVLGRDLSGAEGASFIRGLSRVSNFLRELRSYGRDAPSSLFGYDMPTTPAALPQLLALHIALQTPGPFACDTQLSAAVILSDIGRKFSQLPPARQARYALVVASAIRTVRVRHVLVRACTAIAEWPEIDDDHWQTSVKELLLAVEKHGDDSLRRDVWWSLHQQADSLQLDTPVSRQKILHLLTPIGPHLSTKIIGAFVSHEMLQHWSTMTNGKEHAEVRERLRLHIHLPQTTPMKRKRNDSSVQAAVLELLRANVPADMQLDIGMDLESLLKSLGSPLSLTLLNTTRLACVVSQCDEHSHNFLPWNIKHAWFDHSFNDSDELRSLRSLAVLLRHTDPAAAHHSHWPKMLRKAWPGMKSHNRRIRRAAGLLLSAIFRITTNLFPAESAQRRIVHGVPALLKESYAVQETSILLLGDLGRHASDKDLIDVLEILIQQLGSKNIPLRSVAYTQLVDIAAYRNKQPYNLLSPYMDRLSVLLAECLVPNPEVVGATMDFIGYTRQAFFTFEIARKTVIPTLVLRRNKAALETLSTILGQRLGQILIEDAATILAKAFLTPAQTTRALDFLILLVNEQISGSSRNNATTVEKFVRLAIVNLVVNIAVELGDPHHSVQDVATQALTNVQRAVGAAGDLGSFLKPHMLGILSSMGEMLLTPRTSADHKCNILRSIGKLIELVGDSIASFSPQIIASLQSTLDVPDLRLTTLRTWAVYIQFLKFVDVGPFIGPTIAALVESWASFDQQERKVATQIVQVISGDAVHLKAFEDDIVRFDHIKELASHSRTLLKYREQWTTKMYVGKLIERIGSKNLAVSTASMRELRDLLLAKHSDIGRLVRGDAFDPIVGKLITSLLGAATRDGQCDSLKDLTYECFGLLGALDPDRFQTVTAENSMPVMSNFMDHDESANFAIHLIRDLLVGAFRDTNDTKHQKSLAFAIQELLKFCGFDSRLVNRLDTMPPHIRERWARLPKDVLETVTPLLDAQYQQSQVKRTTFNYPIYSTMTTYREWIQSWTVDLIGRILDSRAHGDAQIIFGVFNSEPKNQDVAVAHHLLPHLVLHVLMSGDRTAREQIRVEIQDVLQDQVSPTPDSAPEKRMLSAQVIFDLMDHLSKWLRAARMDRAQQATTTSVNKLLAGIDTELTANAAMKARAFARSLRNFEERIMDLRTVEKRTDTELQTYFESLHEIYAELDEPDGMEGASAYVVSPTLELQIREHESTGRWTAAQSCWEVRLQHSPEDVKFQVGLLKCLQNLGHYDTIRTHVRGVISGNMQGPDMRKELVPFQAEAAWTIGDWNTVAQIAKKNGPPIAKVFLAVRDNTNISDALLQARREIGSTITGREYSRAYDAILQLHMLREVELIHNTDRAISTAHDGRNALAIVRRQADDLIATLSERFDMALPVFRVHEEILNKRRAAFSLMHSNRLRAELGQAWIQSAKIARKARYAQTAYSAALQANESDAPFAFIQSAKLIHQNGDILKALRELKHPVERLIREADDDGVIDLTNNDAPKTEDDFRKHRSLAKAVLLEARWFHEADRFEQNDVIRRFKKATELGVTLESPFFHLGHYYDTLTQTTTNLEQISAYNHFTVLNYHEALQRGVKYIFQTMPRLLTIWLDLGEKPEVKKNSNVAHNFQLITKVIDRSRNKIATYQFLTAFPQIISRFTHAHPEVREVLIKIAYRIVREYPAQSLWPMVGVIQSKRKERREISETIFQKAQNGSTNVTDLAHRIKDAKKLSSVLLKLAEDKPESKAREVSLSAKYAYVKAAFPSTMIMPLQDALTVTLPNTGSSLKGHMPFPLAPVEIHGISDTVEIMPSLQQPKKLVFKGTDGRRYPFLCKPHDDLRKDARLMDFNSMINKFLNSASQSRRRHLYIRTYCVVVLNEECGLLEWVSNTTAFKSIIEKLYQRRNRKIYSTEIYNWLDSARKGPNMMEEVPRVFREKVMPLYEPSVFYEWFLNTWPEPTAWLTSRTNYARTLAVMSMIGYVLGLGDRHGENILFDSLSGDTVHVDLNCLFEKAKTFEVPERVPFRLTHNMVDALGVTGVEGVFRKAAEITIDILRLNNDSLMSVLESFVHDPLVEWTKTHRKMTDKDVRVRADQALRPIERKLRGVISDTERTVPNQVEVLIREATSHVNLGLMYVGWAPWL